MKEAPEPPTFDPARPALEWMFYEIADLLERGYSPNLLALDRMGQRLRAQTDLLRAERDHWKTRALAAEAAVDPADSGGSPDG